MLVICAFAVTACSNESAQRRKAERAFGPEIQHAVTSPDALKAASLAVVSVNGYLKGRNGLFGSTQLDANMIVTAKSDKTRIEVIGSTVPIGYTQAQPVVKVLKPGDYYFSGFTVGPSGRWGRGRVSAPGKPVEFTVAAGEVLNLGAVLFEPSKSQSDRNKLTWSATVSPSDAKVTETITATFPGLATGIESRPFACAACPAN